MLAFVHDHEVVLIVLIVCLTAGLMWHYERWRDRKALSVTPIGYVWQFVAYQGAGNSWSPMPQTQEQAMKWCSEQLGTIAWVDKQHYKIFYRAKS